MSTSLSEFDQSPGEHEMSARRETMLAIAVNVGLGFFLLGSIWQFCVAPSSIEIVNWLKLTLIVFGIGLASFAWVAGLRISLWLKTILISVIVGIVAYNSWETAVEIDSAGRLLQPGRLENGRWVHAGLGVSFAVLPGWEGTTARPFITASQYPSDHREGRLRLWPNERAVFFRMEPQAGRSLPGKRGSSISIEAQIYRFTTLHSLIKTMFYFRSLMASKRGVEITENPRTYQRDGLDFGEFTAFNEKRKSVTRTVFARSGCYLLCFELEAYNKEDSNQFQEFLDSIQITRHPTAFSPSFF